LISASLFFYFLTQHGGFVSIKFKFRWQHVAAERDHGGAGSVAREGLKKKWLKGRVSKNQTLPCLITLSLTPTSSYLAHVQGVLLARIVPFYPAVGGVAELVCVEREKSGTEVGRDACLCFFLPEPQS